MPAPVSLDDLKLEQEFRILTLSTFGEGLQTLNQEQVMILRRMFFGGALVAHKYSRSEAARLKEELEFFGAGMSKGRW